MAAERLARHDRGNAKVMRADARFVIGRLVPAASLHAVHVYFPDPWWKKRHKKRRVFTDALVAGIERALVPGGELRVASDVAEYFARDPKRDRRQSRFREQTLPNTKARSTHSIISPISSGSTAWRAARSSERATS